MKIGDLLQLIWSRFWQRYHCLKEKRLRKRGQYHALRRWVHESDINFLLAKIARDRANQPRTEPMPSIVAPPVPPSSEEPRS